eukprot:3857420-Alexandrium_andersonii.AAC.1
MCGLAGKARCCSSAGWYTKRHPSGPSDCRCPPAASSTALRIILPWTAGSPLRAKYSQIF